MFSNLSTHQLNRISGCKNELSEWIPKLTLTKTFWHCTKNGEINEEIPNRKLHFLYSMIKHFSQHALC